MTDFTAVAAILCAAPLAGGLAGLLAGWAFRWAARLPEPPASPAAATLPVPRLDDRGASSGAGDDSAVFRPIGRVQKGPAAALTELVAEVGAHLDRIATAPTIAAPRAALPAPPQPTLPAAPVYVAPPPALPPAEPVTPLGVREGETCWTCGRPRAVGDHDHAH